MITINDKCIALIKEFESFRANPYHGESDPPKLFTIGYGTTFYPNGVWVQLTDPPITEEKATSLLIWQVHKKARIIDNFLRDDLSPNQFAALISFAYNCGEGALRSSTLLKRVNANPIDTSIRDAFMMWVKGDNGHEIPGLVRRRRAEADLYFTP